MDCPDCGTHLRPFWVPSQTQGEELELDRCNDCGGVWFDAGELTKASGRAVKLGAAKTDRQCPGCQLPLREAELTGGVAVESCAKCRGTFLEARDMDALMKRAPKKAATFSRLGATTPKDSPIHGFARRHFERAMELDPAFKMGGLGLIYMDCQAGERVDRRWIDELASRLPDTPFAPGDTALFHGLKEMLVMGAICLERPDVDAIFEAGLANPRLSQGIQAKLYSWHADYLWLHEHDLPAARSALSQSLALVPSNPSNRLKWAQLMLLEGDRERAGQLLGELRGEYLSKTEQNTLDELLISVVGRVE